MKKLFLAGALALSMAVSATSAFAAVSYGDADTLDVTYDATANTVSVDSDLSSYSGQMTVLVTDTSGEVAASNILYIDQTAAAADIFQDMGLLLANEATTLPIGTYYVKVGGENVASILLGTIIVSEDQQVTFDTIKNGDVNYDNSVAVSDALAVIGYVANSANNGSANKYSIGQLLKVSEEVTIKNGDVNTDGSVAVSDALAIIGYVANSANNGSANTYAIGQNIQVIVEE